MKIFICEVMYAYNDPQYVLKKCFKNQKDALKHAKEEAKRLQDIHEVVDKDGTTLWQSSSLTSREHNLIIILELELM